MHYTFPSTMMSTLNCTLWNKQKIIQKNSNDYNKDAPILLWNIAGVICHHRLQLSLWVMYFSSLCIANYLLPPFDSFNPWSIAFTYNKNNCTKWHTNKAFPSWVWDSSRIYIHICWMFIGRWGVLYLPGMKCIIK